MNVSDLIEKSGLTQQEIADRTGIPRARLAQWAIDKAQPKRADYATLVKFFTEIGVWQEENEESPLYKFAYQGALKEIDRLKETGEKESIQWREEIVARQVRIEAYLQVMSQRQDEMYAVVMRGEKLMEGKTVQDVLGDTEVEIERISAEIERELTGKKAPRKERR